MSLDQNRGRGGRRTRMASRGSISRPPMTPREYRAIFARNEQERAACLRNFARDEDRDMMIPVPRADADRWGAGLRMHMLQRSPPSTRRSVAAREVHQVSGVVQIPGDEDEIREDSPSTPEYSPIAPEYTPSTPSEESTARFCSSYSSSTGQN